MIQRRELSDFEILKGCAEYLQIGESEIVSDEYMQEHPDVLDILVNVAIRCKKKAFRESTLHHRQMVVHRLECHNIGFSTRYDAEERTRTRMRKDKTFRRLIQSIANFILKKDYMAGDFEILDAKIVGYHGKQKDVVIPRGLQLGKRAFSGCDTIERITLNDEIRDIPWSAFSICQNLIGVYGLEHVETIAGNAFLGCENLREIELPLGINEIADHAFYGCASLKEIVIPPNVVEIGYAAFLDCNSLRSVTFPSGLKRIHAEAFMCCKSLEDIVIPPSVERIYDAAFAFCKNLKHISFSPQTFVERDAFTATPWETEQAKNGAFITNGLLQKIDE